MSQTILFVVGPPGVGKTTLIRELLEPDSYFVQKPKWTVGPGKRVCAAGHYMGSTFDGADTVPYNGVDAALAYWDSELRAHQLTIFDGDRFSHRGVVARFQRGSQHELRCLHLTAPDEVLAARREARGSHQNPTWLKGRVTKARRFAEEFPGLVLWMDAAQPRTPAWAARVVQAWLSAPTMKP